MEVQQGLVAPFRTQSQRLSGFQRYRLLFLLSGYNLGCSLVVCIYALSTGSEDFSYCVNNKLDDNLVVHFHGYRSPSPVQNPAVTIANQNWLGACCIHPYGDRPVRSNVVDRRGYA